MNPYRNNKLNFSVMKTKVSYLLTKLAVVIVLVAMLVVKANASETPELNVIPFDKESAFIVVNDWSKKYTELSIESENGDLIFFDEGSISDKGYLKPFNFRNLRNGSYRVVVKEGTAESVVNFKIEKGSIVVEKNNVSNKDTFFSIDNNILKFSMINNTNANVTMDIVDADGVIYTKNLGTEFGISTGLNLNKLRAGNYSVIVRAGDNTLSYKFTK